MQRASFGVLGVGVAAIAASIIWSAVAPSAPAQVSIVPGPSGAAVAFSGVFP